MRFGGRLSSLATLRSRLLQRADMDASLVAPAALEEALDLLRARARSMGSGLVSPDAALKAVRAFWQSKQISSFKDTRLVAFSLSLPVGDAGETIMDDLVLFRCAIASIDEWRAKPKLFRRCYHGLVKSYFDYDSARAVQGSSGASNWSRLRTYLADHVGTLSADHQPRPEWVLAAQEYSEVFSSDPFSRLGRIALDGDQHRVSELRSQLLIGDSSWFSRELFFAKLRTACQLSDPEFVKRLPELLDEVATNSVLHDTGLGMLLDRYASGKALPVHRKLRDHTVFRWGNPWLAANTMRWGNVQTKTRELLGEWLKLEFIESFLTLLAEDGHSDKRRMEFWTRYVNEIEHIHFALGAEARASRAKDFVELRRKAKELTVALGDGPAQNNAFIMRMKGFVVVEFSGRSNALYIYRSADTIPFDVTRTVFSATTSRNSLKSPRHLKRLSHQDGIHGYTTWEERFTNVLSVSCKLHPSPSKTTDNRAFPFPLGRRNKVPKSKSQSAKRVLTINDWLNRSYSSAEFERFCAEYKLKVEDLREKGGNVWVYDYLFRRDVARVLELWGFRYKGEREAWWRQ
jgi:hypothetical protein